MDTVNLTNQEVCIMYREILQGKRRRFPNHYFVGAMGKKRLIWLTRYVIEIYLNISVQDIPNRINAETLWQYRLKAPVATQGLSFTELIELTYPNQFYSWDFKQVSRGYWRGEKGQQRAIQAVKYVIEEIKKIPLDDIPKHINTGFFKQNRLVGILESFDKSPYKVMEAIYPGRFRPWEFAHAPLNCWSNEGYIKECMDQLLFEDLKFQSYEEALINLKKSHFFQHQKTGLFARAFNARLRMVKEWITQQNASALETT